MIPQAVLLAAAGLLLAADEANAPSTRQVMDKLQGPWVAVAAERNGVNTFDTEDKDIHLVFTDNKVTFKRLGKEAFDATYTLDPAKGTIDIRPIMGPEEAKRLRGIYRLEGDSLKLCWTDGDRRPTEVATKPKSRLSLLVLKREKP
jgi:uncharacterized protein (TIGR03067 family)